MSPDQHNESLLITAEIDGYVVKKVLIYSNNSTYVLFLDPLKNMGKNKMELKKVFFSLMGFASTTTYLVRAITLSMYLVEGWKTLTINVTFIVVDAPAS